MLAHIEIFIVMFGQHDLLLVIPQLQIRDIIFFHFFDLLALFHLLFALLLFFLDLLGGFLRFARKVLGADLAAENRGLRPVVVLDAELDLIEDEFCFLASLHRSKRLDLQLAQHICGTFNIALLELDVGQDPRHSRSFHLDEDLDRLDQWSWKP